MDGGCSDANKFHAPGKHATIKSFPFLRYLRRVNTHFDFVVNVSEQSKKFTKALPDQSFNNAAAIESFDGGDDSKTGELVGMCCTEIRY